jgi:cobalamin biosynthesis Mg chelatase CobN
MIIERHEKKDNLDGDGACTGWDKLWGLHGCKEKKADAPKTDTITDGNTPNNSGDTSINASGILSSVTNLTSSIFGYVTEKEKSKSEKESDKMALMQSLVAMRAAESQPKSNTGLYVVLGVLAIGLIGLGIYLIKKKPAQVANK